MFIAKPQGHTPLVLVTDFRSRHDADIDVAELKKFGTTEQHVLEGFQVAKKIFGTTGYTHLTRIALFEHDATPTEDERRKQKNELLYYLKTHKPLIAAFIPTVFEQETQRESTQMCWQALRAPDSLAEMRGTYWEYAKRQFALPLFPATLHLKQLQLYQQAHWLKYAHDAAVVNNRLGILECPYKSIDVNERALSMLRGMAHDPVAVDIESIESQNKIIAIGVSNGEYAVSLPFSGFRPYSKGQDAHLRYEMALSSYPLGAECRRALANILSNPADKYFHNFTFDVPRLKKEKFHVKGKIHDTFAAHAIAYPELKHGLQHAVASVCACRPWKSVWHPKLPGITREDEEYWMCDPRAMRDYNCDDCFHTYQLARAILPAVEVKTHVIPERGDVEAESFPVPKDTRAAGDVVSGDDTGRERTA